MFKILYAYEDASVPLTKNITAFVQVSPNIYGYEFAFDRLSIQ